MESSGLSSAVERLKKNIEEREWNTDNIILIKNLLDKILSKEIDISGCNFRDTINILKSFISEGKSGNVPMLVTGKNDDKKFIMKIYVFNKLFGKFNDPSHPMNIELSIMIKNQKLIGNKRTPHLQAILAPPIICENIGNMVSKEECKKLKANKELQNLFGPCNVRKTLKDGLHYPGIKIMSLEYSNKGSFEDYLFDSMDEVINIFDSVPAIGEERAYKLLEEIEMKNLQIYIFQIVYTLYIMQKEFNFIHYDLHLKNILMNTDKDYDKETSKYNVYIVNNKKFYIPILPLTVKIMDFDRSTYDNIQNNFIEYMKRKVKITHHGEMVNDKIFLSGPRYDLHMLLMMLSKNLQDFAESQIAPAHRLCWFLNNLYKGKMLNPENMTIFQASPMPLTKNEEFPDPLKFIMSGYFENLMKKPEGNIVELYQ